ncbi:MAG: type II secretion system F family protein [Deltaproteobacteria bacterium]|nr:type II secretion system F family protein [Deltaproteobacteria bacterium]
MARWDWEGTNERGELKTGTLDAPDKAAVDKYLADNRIAVIRIRKKQQDILAFIPMFKSVPVKTIVIFTRQMATMIDAGLPLVQCLEILATQEPHPGFQKILYNVKESVEQGNTFADSLKKHGKVFDTLFVNLVAAGEMGGILDTILNRLAAYTEKNMKLRARVKGAMKYPLTILTISFLITAGLLWKVVPTFAGMFKSLGNRELPKMTKFMVSLSENFISWAPFIIGGIVAVIVLFRLARRQERIHYWMDWLLLRMPVFGTLVRKASIAKFTRTLGTLVSSGVPILDAMEIVAKTAGNLVVEEAVLYTRDRVAQGKTIAAPLMEKEIFPKMVIQMIAVGESTGALDIMLGKIADFYDDEVDAAVDGITSLMEPIILVILGGLVGSVLISMYMPIFTMADNVGAGS